jgi:imidazole glycerol-phosphate synthase subunit HisF
MVNNCMMVARRIIPALDVHEGRVVKCIRFLNRRDAGDPVDLARLYDQEGADELVFLDITASHERRAIMLDRGWRSRSSSRSR